MKMTVQVAKLLLQVTNRHLFRKIQFSTGNTPGRGKLIINCKRQNYNFYQNDYYSDLDKIPLASTGWTHNKSKGDFFIIQPPQDDSDQQYYSFQDMGISPELIRCLHEMNIEKATAFQAEAVRLVQRKNHVVLAAETGCGKTIAYLLPIVQSLIGGKTEIFNSPKALIVVPNRELAHQVGEVAYRLASRFDLTVKTVVGGRTKKLMMNPEFTEVDILVGTPGVLGKLSTVGILKFDDVSHTVFDEADTLLDDSFTERVAMIMKRVFSSQIIFVSATLPKLLPDILKPIEPTLQQVVSPRLHRPLLNISQKFLRITRALKSSYLLEVLKKNDKPMIIFTNKNETCNWLAMFIRENNYECANINGDMNFAIRIQQWEDFVKGNVQILVATDIASRGLNTTQVKHVLNYDFPLYAADYLHRVGRIGRFGSPKSCSATNFIAGSSEVKLVQQIELAIRRRLPLENVNANITGIVKEKNIQRMKDAF